MSDVHLLVPVNIAALVIPSQQISGTKWVDLKPDFRGLNNEGPAGRRFLGQDIGKGNTELTGADKLYEPGIHLHWALPDGLTHGVTRNSNTGPEFPAIPNRWLVVRFCDYRASEEQLDLRFKAWIMESDTVTDEPNATVWPTLKPGKRKLEKSEDYYVYVGKRYELAKWPGEMTPPAARVNITTIGYGDPAFAAYYPACKGILGFHDKEVADLPQNAVLTYLVVGWYSDPSLDPLHQSLTDKTADDLATQFTRLEDFLAKVRWVYPGFTDALTKVQKLAALEVDRQEADAMVKNLQAAPKDGTIDNRTAIAALEQKSATLQQEIQSASAATGALRNALPAHVLCHGITTGVQWTSTQKSGVPAQNTPYRIAVGNTAVDALAALFAKFATDYGEERAKLLSVFQYDLLSELEKPGGSVIVEHKIHERSYGRLTRGIRWDLLQEDRPTFSGSLKDRVVPMEDRPPPVPGDVRLLLEHLNIRQRHINRLKRERDSLRSELYATWYRKGLNSNATEEKKEREKLLNQRVTSLQQEIEHVTNAIVALEDEKERRPKGTEWEDIQRKLHNFLPGWKLQQFDEPEFWRANDPVVLLAGPAFQRSQRHSQDGRYRSDGRLLCRLSGQEITRLKIKIPYAINQKDVEFGPADIETWGAPNAVLKDRPVPTEVRSLLYEALLLTLNPLDLKIKSSDQETPKIDPKRALAIITAAYEKNQPGLAKEHTADIQAGASWLLKTYYKKVWEEAEDPKVDQPRLRYPETDTADQMTCELGGTFPSSVVMSQWEKNPWLPLFLQWEVGWEPTSGDVSQAFDNWELTGHGTTFTWRGKTGPAQEPVKYRGTTLLTPNATLLLSDRLRRYNLTHDNAMLRTFESAVRAMCVLCQSLGGFTEQLLMRKAYLEVQPLELKRERRTESLQFSPIFDDVKDIDWLAPLMRGKFLPLRSGQLKLRQLWIIDAFGQLLQIEKLPSENTKGEGTLFNPAVPQRARGADGAIRLEPRLAQPARLSIQWLPANRFGPLSKEEPSLRDDEEFNPVCGWILPNFLDEGLMIYDARGHALGALQRVLRKSWRAGVGGVHPELESFHWIDIPGSKNFFFGASPQTITDPLDEKANPHLRAFVKGLLSLTEGRGQAFSDLLNTMSEAFSGAGGEGSGHNPNLALLIGRPLALVRASLRLEVDGRLACAQGWNDLQQMQTGKVEQLNARVRLGDRRKWHDVWLGDDGLVGFFLNQNYTEFYPAFGLRGRKDDPYNKYSWAADPAVPNDESYLKNLQPLSIEKPLDLTLLMEPSRGVCVTSGILPRTIFHLPSGDLAETLENKQVIFFTGPVVSPEDEKEIRMPQPSDIYGQWSWTHHPEVKVWDEKRAIVDVQNEQGRFSETPLQIAEGWLKLITAPLAINSFTVKGKNPIEEEKKDSTAGRNAEPVKPERFTVTKSGNIILTWSVSGAEQLELKQEVGQQSVSLFSTHRHPLPMQYALQVKQNTSFTLVASDREGTTVKRHILLQIS